MSSYLGKVLNDLDGRESCPVTERRGKQAWYPMEGVHQQYSEAAFSRETAGIFSVDAYPLAVFQVGKGPLAKNVFLSIQREAIFNP
jgi:hypothetical protein